jgi:membrane peptidoglycan carboxypeptidase
VDRQRARVGVDGLSGRRHAAADGAAVSSVANGGELVEPRVVRAVYRDNRRYAVQPKVVRRTISADTAATLTAIMEQVVERGTAKRAQIPATRSPARPAPRTSSSTAATRIRLQRLVRRLRAVARSGADDHRRHRLAAAAERSLRRTVSAPIFKRIAEATLRISAIGRRSIPPPVLVARQRADGVDGSGPNAADRQLVATAAGTVPDLPG